MVADKEALALPSQINVYNVEQLRETMIRWVDESNNQVRLRGDGVESIDAVGLQLLIACHKAAVRRNKGFIIESPSPVLQEILLYSGADKILAVGR